MEKLYFEDAIYELKKGNVVFIYDKKPTFFGRIKEDTIRVYNDTTRYNITFLDLRTLFSKEQFYLYEKKEQIYIDKEKDDEYYSWWHK